tara:strand:+ start:3374 stop:4024 length:651 start_codon:yes stop_codon:yes gene_type:complete
MNEDFFSSKPQQISKSAFEIAKKIFGDLTLVKAIVVGENNLSNSILQYLHHNGINKYIFLKEQKEKKLFLRNIKDFLTEYDILITSFKSDKILIKREEIIRCIKNRKHKPIFLIDTNIPGNIDTDISKIDNCFLFDLNDLEQFYNDRLTKLKSEPLTNNDFEDILDRIIPDISRELSLDIEKNYFLQEKIKFFLKRNSNVHEKIGILNFFKFLIKK